jgi:hypothetical protein
VKHVITQTLEQDDEADFVGSEQNLHIHRQAVRNPAGRTGGSGNGFAT